ncbi:putative fibroin heavy chain [Iris pallida]|uniref:Fibroin heavy chain n=1 Tax=Iris pallida TaxID=29817 RepID=A0AAX6H8D3_IRIPA|nr:putative fibroin heavy chain [Iris pallida]
MLFGVQQTPIHRRRVGAVIVVQDHLKISGIHVLIQDMAYYFLMIIVETGDRYRLRWLVTMEGDGHLIDLVQSENTRGVGSYERGDFYSTLIFWCKLKSGGRNWVLYFAEPRLLGGMQFS